MIDWLDLPELTTFTTGYDSFYRTRSLSLNSMMNNWLLIDWFDLPNLATFTTGDESFKGTRSLSLESMMIYDWLIWSS